MQLHLKNIKLGTNEFNNRMKQWFISYVIQKLTVLYYFSNANN